MDQLKVVSKEGQLEEIEKALKYSFENPHELENAFQLLDEIQTDSIKKYPFLRAVLGHSVVNNFMSTRETEFDKHKWFAKNYESLLGNEYELTTRPNDPKHIPDFWMKKENLLIPVEIKLRNFTNKNLEQLIRYMNFYKSDNGIAVAEKLACSLPENILFISFDELEVNPK